MVILKYLSSWNKNECFYNIIKHKKAKPHINIKYRFLTLSKTTVYTNPFK